MLRLANRNAARVQPSGRSTLNWRPFTQTAPRRSRGSTVVRVLEVDQSSFDAEVLKASNPVLVDFWAPWCGPCKLVKPLMDWAEKEYDGKIKVVKVSHDPNPELVAAYKVYGLPCLVLFKDGAVVEGSLHEGAVTKVWLTKYLEKYGISKEAVSA